MRTFERDRDLRERILGSEMRRARLRAGLTQRDVALRMNYTTSQHISNWERGVGYPPLHRINDLAAALQVSPRVIINAVAYYRERQAMRMRKQMLATITA